MSGSATPRYVLGVNTGPHDASAALLRDGELVAMVEQERLSRRRYAFRESPSDAIAACLAHEGIGLGTVREIAVGWDVPALAEVEGGSFDEREFAGWLLGAAGTAAEAPPLRYVDHHLAHAASSFYTSGAREAAILVVDGRGEANATTLAIGGPGGIEIIETWGTNQSLGHFYGWAAEWAGLTMWGGGKLMGLAAYGRPCQPVPLAATADGYLIDGAPPADRSQVPHHFMQLRSRLRGRFRENNFPFVAGTGDEPMAHADFAASIQSAFEEVLLGLARRARATTGCSTLALAGGVALNCAANGAIIRSGLFDEVWVPPTPNDPGVSLGAAFVADRATAPPAPPQRLAHALWAPAPPPPDANTWALLAELEPTAFADGELAVVVAEYLAQGLLVGWWQGRAEVGQRALGARSILCDPRRRTALLRVNQVKGREVWRPLAPAILADHAGDLFAAPLPAAADFMLAAVPVRADARVRAPATVHVDGSARPQAVAGAEPRFHAVIEAFRERTGLPAIVNTSFNLAGEPIVYSSADAVNTFLRSDLDVLVIDDLVAVRDPRRAAATPAADRERFQNLDFMPWTRPA